MYMSSSITASHKLNDGLKNFVHQGNRYRVCCNICGIYL